MPVERWALYARGNSLDSTAQRLAALRDWAALEDATVVAELVDVGVDRDGRSLAFELVQAGRVDRVVAFSVDRIGRTPADITLWLDAFEGHDVALQALLESVNLTGPEGRAMAGSLTFPAGLEDRQHDEDPSMSRGAGID